ncbi:DNA polymerase [Paracoccus sp. (in: a-proteobacteria)]|uniref:DNA polymerase n=1 Tax=Paracoccus sp. TaxID=267 RepID=UPI0026E047A1|nr:DNA polymerase [Paracoccus sp. (in: a-proteobacteria)]MDO5647353.1 DNA polymerase [Paracoccus sp. (in: a-proteobacteria)]
MMQNVEDEHIIFADCEGDDFLPSLSRMWLIQLAQGPEGEVVAYADQPGYRPISEALSILKNAPAVVFHNGMGYDLFAINKLYPGTLRAEQIIDTLIISRLMDSTATRHSLKDIGEALGVRKGDHDDFSQFTPEMVTYGIQDVKILQAAWTGKAPNGRKFQPFGAFWRKRYAACETEFKTAYVVQKQTNHGFRFDYPKAQMLEAELRQEQVNLERELQDIFPPIVTERYSDKQIDKTTGKPKRLKDHVEVFNPGSRDQIAQRLMAKYDWKPVDMTPTKKPKIDETILGNLEYPEAQAMSRYMTLGKKLGMLADGANSWLKLADHKDDGTYYLHGQVNTLGARTHRMSHFKPNMAQVDKDPRMRSLFLADPGWDLVGVDAEGLELRELAHFLHPYDGGRYVEIVHSGDKSKGTDIHTMNMRAAGLHLRDSAKTMIYAHNYGCFDKKLGLIVQEDAKNAGKPVPKGSPSKLGAALRANIESGIVGLGQLIAKCKAAHNKYSALPGHDGRWIPSASDHSALNTLLQGNGSIVMKKALCVFDDEMTRLGLLDKFAYCGNIHDEFQLTSHPDITEKVMEVGKWSITRAGELLEVRCPLVGSADRGKTWTDTH